MSGHCGQCGAYIEEDDDRPCDNCNLDRALPDGVQIIEDTGDGEGSWFAVISKDARWYLSENSNKWCPTPQVMGGWFMSHQSALKAAHNAPPVPKENA